MSAMTQQPTVEPEPGAAHRSGSLFRAELHRFRARRFIQVLLGLSVVGWLAAVCIGLLNFGAPTEADYADARERMQEFIAAEEAWRADCAREAERGGQDPEVFCGPPLDTSTWRVEDYLDTAPFDFAAAGPAGAMAFAAAAAVLAFLIGATWIGAEWSHRTIVALLFWVPSRLRVMGTKIGVLALAAAAIGVAAQVGWLLMAWILTTFVGNDQEPPDGFWADLLAAQGRSVLLVVLISLIGLGLANLVRNTGASLGVGFVYFAIVENALRIYDPMLDRWLLSTNAIALVLPAGLRVYDYSAMGSGMSEPPSYLVTNLQGGLVVGAFAAVIVGVGVWLFARRDLH
ncbi:ABC transporter permease subunit [Blastococcus capsensis]|uniref:ABC transporter permease subunit n=1 Tax=Blastococcus capsensis TaxID=1564163 RepID=UPI00253FA8CE|nr:ABC transporter permease subunit [Blastococcus capsensis]MDK3257959.1 ABC transporter permease subunit [Blastococcus capsensis]